MTAEDLTIDAAKAVGRSGASGNACFCFVVLFLGSGLKCFPFFSGITPVCHALFALYDPVSLCWYSLNHRFNTENQPSLLLHFRMR